MSFGNAKSEPQEVTAPPGRRRPQLVTLALMAVVAAGLAFAVSGPESSAHGPSYILTAGVNFPVSADIYGGPVSADPTVGCSGGAALLYPGQARCLRYKVTNPLNVPIAVTSLSVSSVGFTPSTTNPSLPACKTSDFSTTAFAPSQSGYVSVPAGGVVYVGEPVTLLNDGNQNNCRNGSFNFAVAGSAQYTAQTQAVLAAPASATWGQPATLTATVTPTTQVQAPPTTTPSGTVTFYQCTNSTCSTTQTLGSASLSGSGVATLSYNFYPPSATTLSLYATYRPAGGSTDWVGSQAPQVHLSVGYTSTISGSQSGGLTVKSGQTVYIASSGRVTGGVTVQPGGALVVGGGSITGGLNSSGATGISLCGASIGGSSTISGSTGPVTIGDGSSCAGNSLTGGLTVSGNTGGIQIVGNSVNGGLVVNNNSGPTSTSVQLVQANTFSGGLSCSGNVASPSDGGHPNSGSGTRSGQCAGSF